MTLFYTVANQTFRSLASFLYHHKTEGMENWIDGGAIIAANHSSYYDPLLIAASAPEKVFFLAKTPLFRFPIFGLCLRLLDTIPLNQKDASGLDLAAKKVEEGKKVVMFPEGGRSFDGELLAFKEGAASLSLKTGRPILPIWIEGAHEVWPRGRRLPRLSGKTLCRLGSPIYPSLFESKPLKEARANMTEFLKQSLLDLRKDSYIK